MSVGIPVLKVILSPTIPPTELRTLHAIARAVRKSGTIQYITYLDHDAGSALFDGHDDDEWAPDGLPEWAN